MICFLQSRNSGFYAGGWHTFAMSCSHRSGCSLGHARRLPWVGNCQNDMFTRNPISCAWRWWSTGHFLGYWGWQVEELVWLVVWAWQKSFGPATKKNMQLRSILLLHVKCMVTLNVLTRSWIETSKKGTSHPKGCMLIYFFMIHVWKACHSLSWRPTRWVIYHHQIWFETIPANPVLKTTSDGPNSTRRRRQNLVFSSSEDSPGKQAREPGRETG